MRQPELFFLVAAEAFTELECEGKEVPSLARESRTARGNNLNDAGLQGEYTNGYKWSVRTHVSTLAWPLRTENAPDSRRSTSTCCPLRDRDAPPPSLSPFSRTGALPRGNDAAALSNVSPNAAGGCELAWLEPALSPTPGYHHASSPNC
jgi:hypothetical protein